MYKLYLDNVQRGAPPIVFDKGEEAEMYADLLYKFGQGFWLVNCIYEYNPATKTWENMAY